MLFNKYLLDKSVYPIIFSTGTDKIHLTFDDGPHPIATPTTLDILKKSKIKATFFLNGKNVQDYPELAKEIIKEGHQIGNHAYSHSSLIFKRKSFIETEIKKTEQVIGSILNINCNFFRPPYGFLNLRTLKIMKEMGMTCVLWNVNSKDYKLPFNQIPKQVISKAKNGSIILLHTNDNTSKKIANYLPNILEKLIEKGFIFDILPV